ncbi:hypothetical protein C9374_005085 [Naegleria lovaniensis]|uniref:Structural maintenance of chromosomes protein n=1 Tax=Naegleria lovaniensis TaxID=51637 RepID=A0AA88KKB4_NAELO|nr:uncharacterized protein C9374_005085 [Naegleria lovaniensis]KAG2382505.1 hypothetical protein C9374_005085 [Naegleria lovaniensis]
MYIKSVTIQGFKSYRDQTFAGQEFSPSQNIIVGRNGSGKSNFFSAISFVLSEKFSKLRSEERQAFLHEGTGRGVLSAFVEIVFDNSDNRLPIDAKEVAIRRTVGLKKDEYRIDGKAVTQREVFNLLESAGLSSSNPYYIVEQGKVATLTTMKDSERLELLKEIAGTKVYDQKRAESLGIMKEAEQKKQKINEAIEYVQERLDELEQEKEELKEFQKLDKDRRCIEYAIFDQELNEATKNLEEIEKARENQHKLANQLHMEKMYLQQVLKDFERDIKLAKLEKDAKQKEKDLLESERQELIRQRTKIDLELKDYQQIHKEDESTRKDVEEELREVNKKIEDITSQLNDEVIPQYENLLREEKEIEEKLQTSERRMNELLSIQGRKNRFNTVEERNRWLQQEIEKLEKSNASYSEQITGRSSETEKLKDTLSNLNRIIEEKKKSFSENRTQIESFQTSYNDLKNERDSLTNQKKELWKEQTETEKETQRFSEELSRAERKLEMTFPRTVTSGIHSVRNIVKERNIAGVYGTVIELIKCDDKYHRAVEVTAGNSLFHLVVENERVSGDIIQAMNQSGAQGRVTFIPLNRLQVSDVDDSIATSEFAPLWKKVKTDSKFEIVVKHLFGKTFVTKDLESGTQFAKDHNVNCVTLAGDQANRKGTLTGGYIEQRQSRMDCMKQIENLRREYKDSHDKSKKLKASISDLDDRLNTCITRLQKVETEVHNSKNTIQHEQQDLQNLEIRKNNIEDNIRSNEELLVRLKSSLSANKETIDSYTKEKDAPLNATLSTREKQELDKLTKTVNDLTKQLQTVSRSRLEQETKRDSLRIQLNTNYIPRKSELQLHMDHLPTDSTFSSQQRLTQLQGDKKSTEDRINDVTESIKVLDQEIDELNEKVKTTQEQLETERAEETKKFQTLQEKANSLEKLLNKKKIWTQKREDCIRQIKELGTLPSDFRKYLESDQKTLMKKLHSTNEKLKKFGHVNKKALDQYEQFSNQKEDFLTKKEELEKGEDAINQLIQVLDRRKDEAILRTFKQVSQNFEEIFQTLVPGGHASLTMKSKKGEGEEEEEEETDETSEVDQFTGVSIKVSFMSSGETEEEQSYHLMQQLSGGQKSLVALCLIFAIQRCDPAPFYLFDEIDAALDSAYRTSVAKMIETLAEKEKIQFITATFKPEMLESAENFYGISFKNKISSIKKITKDEALRVLQEEERLGGIAQPGGEEERPLTPPTHDDHMDDRED